MTMPEIRAVVSPMTMWMAEKTIAEGVKATRKAEELREIENKKKASGEEYNYLLAHAYNEGMHIAAEIMWKMFSSCSAECQKAISEVAKNKDGYLTYSESYFDAFVKELEKVQGYSVRLRTAE